MFVLCSDSMLELVNCHYSYQAKPGTIFLTTFSGANHSAISTQKKNSQIRHLSQISSWKFNQHLGNHSTLPLQLLFSCHPSQDRDVLFFPSSTPKLTPSILEGSRHLWNGRYGNFLLEETYLMASGTCLTPVLFQAAGFHVPVRMDVFFHVLEASKIKWRFFCWCSTPLLVQHGRRATCRSCC